MPDRRIGMPAKPVLYLLDKFAALGHLAAIEPAMGLMADYGVQLRPILQDIHQLRHIRPKSRYLPLQCQRIPGAWGSTASKQPA